MFEYQCSSACGGVTRARAGPYQTETRKPHFNLSRHRPSGLGRRGKCSHRALRDEEEAVLHPADKHSCCLQGCGCPDVDEEDVGRCHVQEEGSAVACDGRLQRGMLLSKRHDHQCCSTLTVQTECRWQSQAQRCRAVKERAAQGLRVMGRHLICGFVQLAAQKEAMSTLISL
jgi:hypothetical protein